MIYSELDTVLTEVEDGQTDKEQLLLPLIKADFTEKIREAGDIAIEIERLVKVGPDAKNALKSAGAVVLRLYRVGPEVFAELVKAAGFSSRQEKELTTLCKTTLDSMSDSVGLMFKSHQRKQPLIQSPEVKELVKAKGQQKYRSESHHQAFISYLVQEGSPSIVLEALTRLSLYQDLHLDDDLKANATLKKLYVEFQKNNMLSPTNVRKASHIIRDSMFQHIKEYPVQVIKDKDGFYTLDLSTSAIPKEEWLTQRSPASFTDACDVKKGVLHLHAVTNNTDFESQNLTISHLAAAARNGIIQKRIKGIKDYTVVSYCNSNVNDDNHQFTSILNDLAAAGTISPRDIKALAYIPVHQEMLHLIARNADALCNDMQGRVHVGIYGSNDRPIVLKSSELQRSISLETLARGAKTLQRLLDEHPTLQRVETSVLTYTDALKAALVYGTEAAQHHSNPKELTGYLKSIKAAVEQADMCFLNNGSRHGSATANKEALNMAYAQQQLAVRTGTPTPAAQLVMQAGRHNVNLTPAVISKILHGKYNNGKSSDILVEKALVETVAKIYEQGMEGDIHKVTFKQLVEGLKTASSRNMDLNDIYTKIEGCPPLMDLLNACDKRTSAGGQIAKIIEQRMNAGYGVAAQSCSM